MLPQFVLQPLRIVFGYGYPAFRSYKAMKIADGHSLVRIQAYWVCLAAVLSLEYVGDIVLSWFPFYHESKLVLIVFLEHNDFEGAMFCYKGLLQPHLNTREAQIDAALQNAQEQVSDISLRTIQHLFVIGQQLLRDAIVQAQNIILNNNINTLPRPPLPPPPPVNPPPSPPTITTATIAATTTIQPLDPVDATITHEAPVAQPSETVVAQETPSTASSSSSSVAITTTQLAFTYANSAFTNLLTVATSSLAAATTQQTPPEPKAAGDANVNETAESPVSNESSGFVELTWSERSTLRHRQPGTSTTLDERGPIAETVLLNSQDLPQDPTQQQPQPRYFGWF